MLVPTALTLSLVLCGSLPMTAAHVQVVKPSLVFAAVFYWVLYRPDLMPPPVAFVLGLVADTLSGAPIGVHAATFVAVHAVLIKQRRFIVEKSFVIVWLGFALVALGGFSLLWILTSIFYATPMEPMGVLFQTWTTVVSFPLVFWLLARCHVAMVHRS
jgi:rod shape-determining protein MreD